MSEITETINKFIETYEYEFESEPLCDVPDIFFNFKEDMHESMCELIAKFEYDIMEHLDARYRYFDEELHALFDKLEELSHD